MRRHRSLRTPLSAVAVAVLLPACATPGRGPLYQWGDFQRRQYELLAGGQAQSSPAEQVRLLEEQAHKVAAAGGRLPPGFRGQLGLVYLENGDVDKARAAWLAELDAFPESRPFMEPLLAKLSPARPAAAPKTRTRSPR